MCCGGGTTCGRFWTALTVLWSLIYVCAGAVQIVTGIFLIISLPKTILCSNVWAGSWNVIAGIGGGMIACFGAPSPRRQRRLLYVAASILIVNTVNAVITEYTFYMAGEGLIIPNFMQIEEDEEEENGIVLNGREQHVKNLVANARVTAGIAAAIILLAAFLDTQFSFCSIDSTKKSQSRMKNGKSGRGSHEQVSDIEYIIPRPKSNSEPKPTNSTIYDAYAQSWVFETENSTVNSNHTPSTPYLKIDQDQGNQEGETTVLANGVHNGINSKTDITSVTVSPPPDHRRIMPKEETIIIANPVVHIEEASDESNSNSNSDRKLCYMKSFSRTPSPVVLSAASSQASLNININPHPSNNNNNNNNPPIYECLEKLTEPTVYRSRLNTALSVKDEPQYASTSPQKKSDLPSPRATDPVQYASLITELEQKLTRQKDKCSAGSVKSPQSQSDTDNSQYESSSKSESQKTDFKSSDAEFSKELEAALQLIQDLESPNTIETPSEPCRSAEEGQRPLAVWRHSDASGSEKTLSAVGSLAELTSPMTECIPEMYTFGKSPSQPVVTTHLQHHHGKNMMCTSGVVVQCTNSQSTSGYSSPTRKLTPNCWSTSSSVDGGSATDLGRTLSFQIRNTQHSAVISLYPEPLLPSSASASAKRRQHNNKIKRIAIPASPYHHQQTNCNFSTLPSGKKSVTVIRINGDDGHEFDFDKTLDMQNNNVPNDKTDVVDVDVDLLPLQPPPSMMTPSSIELLKTTPVRRSSSMSTWNVMSLLRKKKQIPKLSPELESAIIKSESLAHLTDTELLARLEKNKAIQRQIEQRVQQQLGQMTESNC